MENITNDLINYFQNSTEATQQILFLSEVEHPIWDDYLKIIEIANKQILEPLGLIPNEHILAFIGVHAKTLITGKRDSVGFLITNFRVLSQTDMPGLLKAEKAAVNFFTQTNLPEEINTNVWKNFLIKNKLSVPEEQLNAMQAALKNVLSIALPQLQKLNYLPEKIIKTSNIKERIKELELEDVLKSYVENEKKMRKFSEKHSVSDIKFGMVDKPLFGGAYGLVLTPKGITSRDLMQDSVTSTWDAIRSNLATVTDKKDVINAGKENHIIPPYYAEFVAPLIILINEIANGEVVI
ncbi:hypothetical protein Celal_2841 [Cellulophaga algicola DSM 14237]|uniref:Uncharacterized protein n=1 Tax=Cellulophaga algicola (strain DSM 14237 / IC166 / ACAM 630) TaxID=688270 RepID=E6XCX9_CELAD|nr:hypothetical protein [Cellulophaga algicola]ADV50120.1 hypothetical protein Celal_2841 [Cellulophaga algicola DSM 14237]